MSPSELNPQSTRDTTVHSKPRRRRALKWIRIIFLLCLIAILFSFLGWKEYSKNRLQSAIDRIASLGEPLFLEDFDSPEIPDRENAAVLYEQAAKLIADSGKIDKSLLQNCLDSRVDDDKFVSACGALVGAHEEALKLARDARSRTGVSWSFRVKSPLLNQELPELTELRLLAKLLCIKAKLDLVRRQDEDAVQNLEDVLAMSVAVDRQPTFISHLVALSIEAVALNSIEIISSDLGGEGSSDVEGDNLPIRSRVQHLIERLLDDKSLDAEIVRALQFERATQLDAVMQLSSGGKSLDELLNLREEINDPAWVRVLFAPLFTLDGVSMLEHMTHQIKAAQAPSLPEYHEYLESFPVPPWDRTASQFEKFRHLLSRILVPSLSRAVQLHYRLLDHRRMAATALAIRLYEIDHGARPKSLDALVPDYLPRVPADTMSTNGVIRYLPDSEFPRLYSVGSNGLDDGGAYGYRRSGKIDWDVLDTPFFLNGPPPPPSAKEAAKSTP